MIKYRQGADNPVDYMSTHPVNENKTIGSKLAEEYANFVADEAVMKAMTFMKSNLKHIKILHCKKQHRMSDQVHGMK